MGDRKKAVLLVAAHCAPRVLKMTLGTWLSKWDGSYDADVYVSVHKNYHHYHPGIAEITGMEPHVKVVPVDEMYWGKYAPNTMEWLMRYSEAHMRNVVELLGAAKTGSPGFTHVAVLDHDLVFKEDFVGWAVREDCDIACALFGDRTSDVTLGTGMVIPWAPKPSAWHLAMSRRVADMVLAKPEVIMPGVRGGRCFDSLAMMFELAVKQGMRTKVIAEAEAARMVEHLWSMSFNYGPLCTSYDTYNGKLAAFEKRYDETFPSGIGELLKKLKG